MPRAARGPLLEPHHVLPVREHSDLLRQLQHVVEGLIGGGQGRLPGRLDRPGERQDLAAEHWTATLVSLPLIWHGDKSATKDYRDTIF